MPSIPVAGIGFRYASDQSLFVDLGEPFAAGTEQRLLRLLRWQESHPIEGVRNLHPAYNSVLLVFDPIETDHRSLQERLLAAIDESAGVELPEPRTIEIPMRYGGIDGPDLDDVASVHGMTAERVIEIHSAGTYSVSFLGFVPGFAYLSGLSSEIATPRLEQPRTHVPAGSVGIAGNQTAVYPVITPGGWRLIGRTDVKMFDATREDMSLLRIGDQVRFIAA